MVVHDSSQPSVSFPSQLIIHSSEQAVVVSISILRDMPEQLMTLLYAIGIEVDERQVRNNSESFGVLLPVQAESNCNSVSDVTQLLNRLFEYGYEFCTSGIKLVGSAKNLIFRMQHISYNEQSTSNHEQPTDCTVQMSDVELAEVKEESLASSERIQSERGTAKTQAMSDKEITQAKTDSQIKFCPEENRKLDAFKTQIARSGLPYRMEELDFSLCYGNAKLRFLLMRVAAQYQKYVEQGEYRKAQEKLDELKCGFRIP